MNENPNKSMTHEDMKEISEVFEKTILEISILDALYGASSISDYVKNVFQTSIEELHRFGSFKTLATTVNDGAERKRGENGQKEKRCFGFHRDKRELRPQQCSYDEPPTAQCAAMESNLELLKQKQEEIDMTIEKCTVSSRNRSRHRRHRGSGNVSGSPI